MSVESSFSINNCSGEKTRQTKMVSYLLPWIQWLHVFAFLPGITLGYVAIVAIDFYVLLFVQKGKMLFRKNDRNLYLIFAYMMIALMISLTVVSDVLWVSIINRIVKIVFLYWLVIIATSKIVNWQYYTKSLKVLTYLASFVLLFQFFSYVFVGYYYSIRIPFLKYANAETDAMLSNVSTTARFRSIFTEPSHYVYFAMQYLIITLLKEKNTDKKTVLSSLFISACIILSISSTGIVLLCFVWFIYLLSIFRQGKITGGKLFLSLMLIIVFVTGTIFVMKNPTLYASIERLGGGYSTENTVWKRLYANWDQVVQQKRLLAFFGKGIGNIESEFMNSFVYLLITVGYLGTGLVILWLVKLFFSTKLRGKVAVVALSILAAIDMVLFTPTVIGYLIIYENSRLTSEAENS